LKVINLKQQRDGANVSTKATSLVLLVHVRFVADGVHGHEEITD